MTSPDHDALRRALLGCCMLRSLSHEERQRFAPYSRLHHLAAGDPLWRAGVRAQWFHQIISGLIEIRRPTEANGSTHMGFFGPTECPATPVVFGQKAYSADAFVVSANAVILEIDAVEILRCLHEDARIAANANDLLLRQILLLHSKIDVLAAGNVETRLRLFVSNLAERFGDDMGDGALVIPFGISRRQIAEYVHAREETVSRCVSAMRKRGLLELERHSIVVRFAHLS